MTHNPVRDLEALGQSIWVDFLSRGTLDSGEFQRLIEQDGVSGVTSNPSIFEKAIAGTHDYDPAVQALARAGATPAEIYEQLTVADIQRVAGLLRPTYDRTNGQDGLVSLEVAPGLAHDTQGTLAEARRLWSLVDRPNAMIKVPATLAGLPAIQQLTAEGINVNITLLFGLPRYRAVAEAYLSGLEALAATGRALQPVASVASFFLSRIDTVVDARLDRQHQADGPRPALAASLRGQAAIASAKVAYQMYQEIFGSQRFERLARQGARPQRLLWASTSTKDPAYPDTKYIEPLIGPDTINTLPVETLDAYRDHGQPELSLTQAVPAAYQVLSNLPLLGIELDTVTQQLEDEGIQKFARAFDQLLEAIRQKGEAVHAAPSA
jgi:transaldolase